MSCISTLQSLSGPPRIVGANLSKNEVPMKGISLIGRSDVC
jgi:hypothetical protein